MNCFYQFAFDTAFTHVTWCTHLLLYFISYIGLHLFFLSLSNCMTIQWYRQLFYNSYTFNIYNFRGITRGTKLQYQNVCRIMSRDPYMCFCSSGNCFTPSEQIVVPLLLLPCRAYVSRCPFQSIVLFEQTVMSAAVCKYPRLFMAFHLIYCKQVI